MQPPPLSPVVSPVMVAYSQRGLLDNFFCLNHHKFSLGHGRREKGVGDSRLLSSSFRVGTFHATPEDLEVIL